jgi:hypothetical protein
MKQLLFLALASIKRSIPFGIGQRGKDHNSASKSRLWRFRLLCPLDFAICKTTPLFYYTNYHLSMHLVHVDINKGNRRKDIPASG